MKNNGPIKGLTKNIINETFGLKTKKRACKVSKVCAKKKGAAKEPKPREVKREDYTDEQKQIIAFEYGQASKSAQPIHFAFLALLEKAKEKKRGYEFFEKSNANVFSKFISDNAAIEEAWKKIQTNCIKEVRTLFMDGIIAMQGGFGLNTVGIEITCPPPSQNKTADMNLIVDSQKKTYVTLHLTRKQRQQLLSRTAVIGREYVVETTTGIVLGYMYEDRITKNEKLSAEIYARLKPKGNAQVTAFGLPVLQMSDLKEMCKTPEKPVGDYLANKESSSKKPVSTNAAFNPTVAILR